MNKSLILKSWSLAVGAAETFTGLLLIFSPLGVLRLLHIQPPSSDALVFLSWIGAFVTAVGMSYGLALGKTGSRGEAVWWVTSLVRMMVALFLTAQVVAGSLPRAWMLVAVFDAGVAIAQWVIIRMGWWKEAAH